MVTKKIFTNCFLVRDGQVCLAMKKRGFGMGLWNGAGGKPKEDETIEQATKREAEEELGVVLKKYQKCGEFHFILNKEELDVTMHAFLATSWDGEPIETEEMSPKWFLANEVPYGKMWKSDGEFLPLLLSGQKVKGEYTFEKEGGKVISKDIKVVERF